ncbi:hypothetical protein [Nocardia noduli]|uniref:hypothetical protein n=1 Tax=Nocardia noduli TaxID=2815722 RepID=UPI001C228421|nr:hypothetical protein [Nocardia noduli]
MASVGIATRDVTVTVTIDEQEWRLLEEAADGAGMTVAAYIDWNTRLLAQQARPVATTARLRQRLSRSRRAPALFDEPEEQAWSSSFTQWLSHRTDLCRED